MNKLVLSAILFLLVFNWAVPNASALSCMYRTSEELRSDSYTVFKGEVTDILEANYNGSEVPVIIFDVNEYWGGPVYSQSAVYNLAHMWDTLQIGKEYLIYADEGEGGVLVLNLCKYSMETDSVTAQEHLSVLGSGSLPEDPPEPVGGEIGGDWTLVLFGLALAGVATYVFFKIKKKAKSI